MKEVTLAASLRATRGKGPARRNRMAGDIPAIIYGPEIEPVPIAVSERALRSAVKEASGTSTIFSLEVNGKVNKVLIRDIQRDPVTSHVTHVDFHAISMNKPIHLSVPVRVIGIAKGVKTDGGILQVTMRELEISCLPVDIPEHIDLDVSELGIGESVHVKDLQVANAKILTEPQRTIVVVAAPTVIKSETVETAAVAEEGAAEGAAEEGAKTEEKKEKKEEK